MARFVVLEHDHPDGTHWDLMLETGSVLTTWALSQPPDAVATITARALPDHRTMYLDYEGPISQGRGSVTRWDRGEYRVERQDETEWVLILDGARLDGLATLKQQPDSAQAWEFSFAAERP